MSGSGDGELTTNRYGKDDVRILRVVRESPKHEPYELVCRILLEGPFDRAFTHADNSTLVPTETQKNTLYALAKKYPVNPLERWTVLVAQDFMNRHTHIEAVSLEVDRKPWKRVVVDGQEHNHCFERGSGGVHFVKMRLTRTKQLSLSGGVREFQIMKTTQSGFAGFIRDEYTTLKESSDRIMSTRVLCEWEYAASLANIESIDFDTVHASVLPLLIKFIAGPADKGVYSASVQATLYNCAQALLRMFPVLNKVFFQLPNVHFYLAPFHEYKTPLQNNNEVFFTFDGARGLIEGTIARKPRSRL